MWVRLGDKLVEAEMHDNTFKIKSKIKRVKRPDGTVNVVVQVPCLQISGNKKGE